MGEARHGILGTLGMLGARIRFGMLLRSLSMQPHEQTRSCFAGVDALEILELYFTYKGTSLIFYIKNHHFLLSVVFCMH